MFPILNKTNYYTEGKLKWCSNRDQPNHFLRKTQLSFLLLHSGSVVRQPPKHLHPLAGTQCVNTVKHPLAVGLDTSFNSCTTLMSTSRFCLIPLPRHLSAQVLHDLKCYIFIMLQQIFNTAAVTNQMMQPHLCVQTRFQ